MQLLLNSNEKHFLEILTFVVVVYSIQILYLLSEHVLDLDLDEKIERRMNRIVGGNGEGVFYCCGVCSRTYKDKTKMRHHIETHLDSYHSCPICQQQYKTRRTLKTHIARSHQNSTSAFGSQLLEVEMPDEVVE